MWIPRWNLKREALAKLKPMKCTLCSWMESSLTKARERATSACSCRRVSVSGSVHGYSRQYKGYNLIGVTTVEEGATIGTTALVYLQLHISLYTGTVHVLSRVAGIHPLVWPPARDVGRCPQAYSSDFTSLPDPIGCYWRPSDQTSFQSFFSLTCWAWGNAVSLKCRHQHSIAQSAYIISLWIGRHTHLDSPQVTSKNFVVAETESDCCNVNKELLTANC